MNAPRLGVLVGLAAEANLLRRHLPSGFDVAVELSGARIERAKSAAARLLAAGTTHLLSFGYAGGLSADYPPGTLLLPEEIRTRDGSIYRADTAWHDTVQRMLGLPAPVLSPLFGSNEIVQGTEEKARLFRETGAASVDMESHVAAAAAQSRRLPFLAIRVLIDAADHPIPDAASASLRGDGSVDLIALLGSLVRRPQQIPAMITLGRDAGRARQALLRCSRRCGGFGFGVG